MQYISDPSLVSTEYAQYGLAQEIDAYKNRRVTSDLYTISLIGPLFYMIASGLTIGLADYFQGRVWLMLIPGLAFLLLWWQRYHHIPPTPGADHEEYVRWNRQQWYLIHLGALIWSGIATSTACIELHTSNAVIVTMITTIAFSTAASHSFAMHPQQARLCIIEFVLPPTFIYLFYAVDLRAIGIAICIYFVYLMMNLHGNAKEYRKQIETEVMLIQSRAELAQLSLTDALTGLPNRRSYEATWNHVWRIAARKNDVLGLLIIDLDFFKKVNDQYGHLAGDACLKHFAQILRQQIRRDSDVVARIGGEEFVAILPGVTNELAYSMAENLRHVLAEMPCEIATQKIYLTASIGAGIADWTKDKTPADTFQRVDKACYQAKEQGRNLVKCA
ncbi:GGDEF domain-containing protein [Undibacterium sp. Dicai25W]|uniref:GGDEF domain-containing protein n=1 Tax=Undibacterium sp. Dicai25W TaxID=3413034 RepID=UPI003BF10436